MLGLHLQAGHSGATAHRVYGVSEADFRHLTGTELEAYRAYSQSWQEALDLTYGSPCRYIDGAPEKCTLSSEHSVAKSAANQTPNALEAVLGLLITMTDNQTR
jgi:hypothetical protein